MEILYASFDKKGKLNSRLGVNTLEAYQAEDRLIEQGDLEGKLNLPYGSVNFAEDAYLIKASDNLNAAVQELYTTKIKPHVEKRSALGAVLKLHKVGKKYLVTYAVKAEPQIVEATDMVIIAKCHNSIEEANFFCGIRRAKEPGKGKPATAGGKIDFYRDENSIERPESPLYAALRECGEEILKISNYKQFKTRFDIVDPQTVTIELSTGETTYGTVLYHGVVETGNDQIQDGGEVYNGGTEKRIHKTHVFSLYVDLHGLATSKDDVLNLLSPDTDAASGFVLELSKDKISADTFGIKHHYDVLKCALPKYVE